MNNLNVDTIKHEILKQRMCWIAKDEDAKLSQVGYSYKGRITFEDEKTHLNVDIQIKD